MGICVAPGWTPPPCAMVKDSTKESSLRKRPDPPVAATAQKKESPQSADGGYRACGERIRTADPLRFSVVSQFQEVGTVMVKPSRPAVDAGSVTVFVSWS